MKIISLLFLSTLFIAPITIHADVSFYFCKTNKMGLYYKPTAIFKPFKEIELWQPLLAIDSFTGWRKVLVSSNTIGWMKVESMMAEKEFNRYTSPSQSARQQMDILQKAANKFKEKTISSAKFAYCIKTDMSILKKPDAKSQVVAIGKFGDFFEVKNELDGWDEVMLENGQNGFILDENLGDKKKVDDFLSSRMKNDIIKVTAVKIIRPTKKRVIVHTGPSHDATAIGYLLKSDTVLVADECGGFDRIFFLNTSGWISSAFLKKDYDLSKSRIGEELRFSDFNSNSTGDYKHLNEKQSEGVSFKDSSDKILYVKMQMLDNRKRSLETRKIKLRKEKEEQEAVLKKEITSNLDTQKKRFDTEISDLALRIEINNKNLANGDPEQKDSINKEITGLRDELEKWELNQEKQLEAVRLEKINEIKKRQDSLDIQKISASRLKKRLKGINDDKSASADSLRKMIENEEKKLKVAGLDMDRLRKNIQENLSQARKMFDFEKKQKEQEILDKEKLIEKENRAKMDEIKNKIKADSVMLSNLKIALQDSQRIFVEERQKNFDKEFSLKALELKEKLDETMGHLEKEQQDVLEQQRQLENGSTSKKDETDIIRQKQALQEEWKKLEKEKAKFAMERKKFEDERRLFETDKKNINARQKDR